MLVNFVDPELGQETMGIACFCFLMLGTQPEDLKGGAWKLPKDLSFICLAVDAGSWPGHWPMLSAGTLAPGLSKWSGLLRSMLSGVSRGSLPRDREPGGRHTALYALALGVAVHLYQWFTHRILIYRSDWGMTLRSQCHWKKNLFLTVFKRREHAMLFKTRWGSTRFG